MAERVSVVRARTHFATLVAKVAANGIPIIIERRGRPLAALVSLHDFQQVARQGATSAQPHGALALVGAWQAIDDRVLDALVEDLYAQRREDIVRPASLPD